MLLTFMAPRSCPLGNGKKKEGMSSGPTNFVEKGVKWYITHTTSGFHIPKGDKGDWG